jgi:1-phosphofructokinase family hexose kinase
VLEPGTTVRTADTRASFGGKGINVARSVARIGAPVTALGLAGEDQATPIERYLESLGVAAYFIRTPGETRTNLKIIEQANGRLTEINGSGAEVTNEHVGALERELLSVAGQEDVGVIVFAGSLPLGVDASVYARWTQILAESQPNLRVLVDASDEALEQAARARPFFLKPNRVEAAALTGIRIETDADAAEAASQILALGVGGLLLSLGSAGAIAGWGSELQRLPASSISVPAGQLQTTVGAGDAMVARIAVELAKLDGADVEQGTFFAMCRMAVGEAEAQIGVAVASGPAPSTGYPGVVSADGESQGAVPMLDR